MKNYFSLYQNIKKNFNFSYREGVTHHSVLSSLSASYNGIGELSYYEDLAKNIDANLAEVDMESFRAEDIHSLLTNLPSLGSDKKKRRKVINFNFLKKKFKIIKTLTFIDQGSG